MPLPIVKLLSQRVSKHCNNLELNPNKIGQNQGFTMVELLFTLVLLITLTSIAVPSFLGALKRWEAKEVRNQLTSSPR